MKALSWQQALNTATAIMFAAVPGLVLQASELHGSAAITTDYYWRGYSKSDGQASAQLNLDFSSITDGSGYFVGSWLSSVRFDNRSGANDADAELILYAGWSQPISDNFVLDLQLSHYVFNDELFSNDADYSEFYVFLHFQDLLTVEMAYAPDAYSLGDSILNSQVTLRYPLHRYIDVSAGAGYYAARDTFYYDYKYWNAGFTWKQNHFSIDIRHFGARESNYKRPSPATPYRPYNSRSLPFNRSTTVMTMSAGF